MDYLHSIKKAIAYIESNLTSELKYSDVAKVAGISSSYFQQIFTMVCGFSLGTYIRKRKFTKAALDILIDKQSITTVAYKYGYTPDSFTKVFKKIHGCVPSKLKSISQINMFNRLNIQSIMEGEFMDYKIIDNKSFTLLGYKKNLNCSLENRSKEVTNMWLESRDKQYELLKYRKSEDIRWVEVSTNVSDSGFDHYITVDTEETSKDFETLVIPEKTYAVFKTDKCSYPTEIYMELRKQIFSNWITNNNYVLDNGPELVIDYWYPSAEEKTNRYMEIWLPVKHK